MKVKPIEWKSKVENMRNEDEFLRIETLFCGELQIGRVTLAPDQIVSAIDFHNNYCKHYLATSEKARFWVEKQFTDFITSITTE